MDQIEQYEKMQELYRQKEARLNKLFDQLLERLTQHMTAHYTKNGETLAEANKYNRLEALNKQLDQTSQATYNQVVQTTDATEEESFNAMYLFYAYVLYAALSDEEEQYSEINQANAAVSVAVLVAYLLLKRRKKAFDWYKEQTDDLLLVFGKHKADLLYNLQVDIKANLVGERGLKDILDKLKKRVDNAKAYARNQLHNRFNDAVNAATEDVHSTVSDVDAAVQDLPKAERPKVERKASSNTDKRFKKFDTDKLLEKMWLSMRDLQVRDEHRILDSQIADKDGYFHFGGDKAKRPKRWKDPKMNWGCRCKVFLLLNGRLPRTSKIYDYNDKAYQTELQARITQLTKNGRYTYLQAYKKATSELKPPRKTVTGYITFNDFLKKYTEN